MANVDPKRAAELARSGVIFVCATCVHMHKATDDGRKNCNRLQCGSPLSGKMFPDYTGPLTRDYLKKVCFFTGQDSNMAIRLVDGFAVLGISESHVHLIEDSEHADDFFLMFGDQIIKRRMSRRVTNLAKIINGNG